MDWRWNNWSPWPLKPGGGWVGAWGGDWRERERERQREGWGFPWLFVYGHSLRFYKP